MNPLAACAAIFFVALFLGDVTAQENEATPFRLIGAWRNAQEARRTLRLLHRTAYFAWDWAEDIQP